MGTHDVEEHPAEHWSKDLQAVSKEVNRPCIQSCAAHQSSSRATQHVRCNGPIEVWKTRQGETHEEEDAQAVVAGSDLRNLCRIGALRCQERGCCEADTCGDAATHALRLGLDWPAAL